MDFCKSLKKKLDRNYAKTIEKIRSPCLVIGCLEMCRANLACNLQ